MCVRYLLTTEEKKDFLAKIFRIFFSSKSVLYECVLTSKKIYPLNLTKTNPDTKVQFFLFHNAP